MAAVIYYFVVTFDRTEVGDLMPGEPLQVPSAENARRRVAALAGAHAGILAFSRTGDPATGNYEAAVILSQAGDVDLDALAG